MIDGSMPHEPAALRPPPWAEKYRWHWIIDADKDFHLVEWWHREQWRFSSGIRHHWRSLIDRGYRYSHPANPSARVLDPDDEATISCVERALENVPNHFYRENDLLPETVWEICRYGINAEPEIVVMCGYATEADAEEYMDDIISRARAKAVLIALKEMP